MPSPTFGRGVAMIACCGPRNISLVLPLDWAMVCSSGPAGDGEPPPRAAMQRWRSDVPPLQCICPKNSCRGAMDLSSPAAHHPH